MKVRYCSDLHLEFNNLPNFTPSEDEVLLVAGDTAITTYLKHNRTDADARKFKKKFGKFLESISGYRMVYFIGGNHEHYMGDIRHGAWIFR